MSDKQVKKINGVTGHYWPLKLHKEGRILMVGWYFDNPGNNSLAAYRFNGYRPEDRSKTGRVYVLDAELAEGQLELEAATDFYTNLNRKRDCFFQAEQVTDPDKCDLLIFAVECGVHDPIMLRSLANQIDYRGGPQNILMLHPDAEQIHLHTQGMHLFIQPDGSVCS